MMKFYIRIVAPEVTVYNILIMYRVQQQQYGIGF